MAIVDPYASNYPTSWGAEVTVVTKYGKRLMRSRKDCKGDPELALHDEEMHHKPMGLLQHGKLDDTPVNELCNRVLSMPTNMNRTPLFSNFITHILDY